MNKRIIIKISISVSCVFIIATDGTDGILCRKVNHIIFGNSDRKELIELYNMLDVSISESDFISTIMDFEPKYIEVNVKNEGYVICERRNFTFSHWKMNIDFIDKHIVAVYIRDMDNNNHPQDAPRDKIREL